MQKTKENKRKIPIKNYIKLALIFILTITLVLYLSYWYKSYQNYQKKTPVLNGVISEVRYNEIYNYINDNQSALIYIGVANDDDCRKIENDLKRIIEKRHLKEKIVYFNITDVNDKELLFQEFNSRYSQGHNVYTYPSIILIDEGKIVDFRSKTANKNLLASDVEQFLEEYEIHGD